jgi:type IV pilus assembly protein PilM
MIGCNCITKLLLADTKIKSKMPLLAVQIDKNFISLNLYEKGQLAFSRFASISAEDYGDSEDYVFEAVNENIFRMLQFQRSRNTGETVENIVFYGEIGDNAYYARLVDEVGKMELHGETLTAPPQIHGYENLKFELYANAIGAMFKRNKDTEKINLLETDTVNNNKIKSDNSYRYMLLGAVGGCAVIVGVIWGILTGINSGITSDIEEYQTKINSPETVAQLALHERLTTMQEEVQTYLTSVENLYDAMISQPVVLGAEYEKLDEVLQATASELNVKNAYIISPQYSNGVFTFSVKCEAVDEPSQKLPAKFVENLLNDEDNYFVSVDYSNYTVNQETSSTVQTVDATTNTVVTTTTQTTSTVTFSLTAKLNADSTLKNKPIYSSTASDDDAESEEGAE